MRLPFAVPRFEPLVRIGLFLRVVRPSGLKKFAAPSVTRIRNLDLAWIE